MDSGTQNQKKDVKILALDNQVQELKILSAKQSTYQDRNNSINVGNKRFNNSVSSWKTTAPKSGESWKKENNMRIFTGANGMNTGLQLTTPKISECNTIPQQIIPAEQNCETKNYWRSIWHLLKVIK